MKTFEWEHLVTATDTSMMGVAYFSTIVDWQGRCREEFGLLHFPAYMAEVAGSDGQSMVTCSVSCEYVGECGFGDRVIVRMAIPRIQLNLIEGTFTMHRRTSTGEELVARGEQTWANVRRDGAALVPAPYPREVIEVCQQHFDSDITRAHVDPIHPTPSVHPPQPRSATVNEFTRRKLAQWIRAIDTNLDGIATRDDFGICGDRCSAGLAIPGDNDLAVRLREAFYAVWDKVLSPSGEYDATGAGAAEVAQALGTRLFTEPDKYVPTVVAVIDTLFEMMDRDEDGKVSEAEYTQIMRLIGQVPEGTSIGVFRNADADDDGRITIDDFRKIEADFFFGTDPADPAANLMGLLPAG